MKIGQKFQGEVTAVRPYGAFVDLENGVNGLIHISEIKTGYIDNIYNELFVGQKVTVQIIDYDEYSKQASLSMRTLEEEKYHYPYRHRFSDNRLNIGFAPLKKELPGWIREGLADLQSK